MKNVRGVKYGVCMEGHQAAGRARSLSGMLQEGRLSACGETERQRRQLQAGSENQDTHTHHRTHKPSPQPRSGALRVPGSSKRRVSAAADSYTATDSISPLLTTLRLLSRRLRRRSPWRA